MGWTTGHRSKEEAFKAVGLRPEIEIIDRKASADGDWLIVRRKGRLEIAIVRLKRYGANDWGEGGAWGETSGPYESGCPVEWFDRVPAPTAAEVGEESALWAAQFRERVRNEAANKLASAAKIRGFYAGCVVSLPSNWSLRGPFTLTQRKGRSWLATIEGSCQLVKLGPKALAVATIEQSARSQSA